MFLSILSICISHRQFYEHLENHLFIYFDFDDVSRTEANKSRHFYFGGYQTAHALYKYKQAFQSKPEGRMSFRYPTKNFQTLPREGPL